MIIDFLSELYNVVMIKENEYFEIIYFLLMVFFIAPLGLGSVLYIIYYCMKDCHESRRMLPFAIFVAYVSNYLMFIWTLLYFSAIYPEEKVYVISGYNDHYDENLPESKKYTYATQTKTMYIVSHSMQPLALGVLFTIYYCMVLDWVSRHKNQQKAY